MKRQQSWLTRDEVVSNESELVEDKETEGQEETASAKLWKMRQMYLSRTGRLHYPH